MLTPVFDLVNAGPNYRFATAQAVVKNCRLLALNYGAGYEKLIVMAKNVAGLDLTIGDPEWIETTDTTGKKTKVSGHGTGAKKVVADYRASNPKVTAMWKTLDNGLRSSVGSDFVMVMPSGKEMIYEDVRADVRIEKDKETGMPRRRTVYTASIGGRRTITYGSKIFENACQACARDVFYFHAAKLEDAGFNMLIGVYDEAVVECLPDRTVEEVKKIMSETPPWLPGTPVVADAKELVCYCK